MILKIDTHPFWLMRRGDYTRRGLHMPFVAHVSHLTEHRVYIRTSKFSQTYERRSGLAVLATFEEKELADAALTALYNVSGHKAAWEMAEAARLLTRAADKRIEAVTRAAYPVAVNAETITDEWSGEL